MKYLKTLISATTKREAKKIVGLLVDRRLIAGALISEGDSFYWWKKKLVERPYWNVSAFTTKTHMKEIIAQVRSVHSDEVPLVSFFEIYDANIEFLKWISEST